MTSEIYEILRQGLTAMFLLSIPIVAGAAVGGIVVGVLQAVTGVHDSGISYGVRFIALLVVLYVFVGSLSQSIYTLFSISLEPWR